ncbi:hypothetical protein AB4Z25_11740 [Rhizobium sp. RAF36]|uniref:hypothetical protein n=1 Tax=Rhizobium sp. RAF36 TaxID=3233055 RepID=UPI003F9C9183
MASEPKRADARVSEEEVNLVEKYGPIGPSAVRAAVSVRSRKPLQNRKTDKFDHLLAPEHLPER